MSVVGIGVDIVSLKRMQTALERTPKLKQKVFCVSEQMYCDAQNRPYVHYAARFAAKEAVIKALGAGVFHGVNFTDIEIIKNERGKPAVILHNKALKCALEQGIVDVHISLSTTDHTAVSNAVAATEKPVEESEEKRNPLEELRQSFKEARSVLDELERGGAV